MNQRKVGKSHSKTRSQGRNQCSVAAALVQKASGSSCASRHQRLTMGLTSWHALMGRHSLYGSPGRVVLMAQAAFGSCRLMPGSLSEKDSLQAALRLCADVITQFLRQEADRSSQGIFINAL